MKKILSAVIALLCVFSLASCSLLRDAAPKETKKEQPAPKQTETSGGGIVVPEESETAPVTPVQTSSDTKEPVSSASAVGIYSEKLEGGVYTFTSVEKYKSAWEAGKDIVVFDVIPSNEKTLTGTSFKDTWIAESSKQSDKYAVFSFMIVMTMAGGEEKTYNIATYEDTLKVDGSYLEVYLYDDIRYAEGEWHSHITDETTDSTTVISSIKLTAGEKIGDVEEIKLTAFAAGSTGLGATVTLTPDN